MTVQNQVRQVMPMALVAFGAWLVLASVVLSFSGSNQTTNLMISTTARPTMIQGAPTMQGTMRSNGLRATQQDIDAAQYEVGYAAAGAAAVGMAAATAETQHFIPLPLAATGLSLALMAIVVYMYNQVQRTAAFAADEEMGERIAMMATSGSGKVSGEILITVEKPVGLTLEEKSPEGGVKVGFVNPLGNAGKAGIKPGDTVIYTSSFFGDELWPADKVTFTRSAITACPNAIDFVVMRGAAADQVNVKRLPKRPAPDKMQRKLTPQQKARATHICIDCGYIYSLAKPFAEQGKNYRCPQCQATKIRFAEYDAETGKTIGKGDLPLGTISGVVFGIALVGGLAYLGLAL